MKDEFKIDTLKKAETLSYIEKLNTKPLKVRITETGKEFVNTIETQKELQFKKLESRVMEVV